MCFAIPKKIQSIQDKYIITSDGNKVKTGGLKLRNGDYVLVYGDIVVEKIQPLSASYFLEQIRAAGEIEE